MRTVTSLCSPAPAWSEAWFCENPSCSVAYFDAVGARVDKTQVRVPIFQKETDPARTVCYCFGHRVADVLEAQLADGSNPLIAEIGEACRKGLDRCEETNPQGRCCLGNVRGLVRLQDASDCCGGAA